MSMNKLSSAIIEHLKTPHITEADEAIKGVAYLGTDVDREFAGLTPEESHFAPVVTRFDRKPADEIAEHNADMYDSATREKQLGSFVTHFLIHFEKRNPDSYEWPFVYAERLDDLHRSLKSNQNNKKH